MLRMVLRGVMGLVLLMAATYAGDWMVWRLVRGGGMRVVPVSREVVAPLKGGREEYYYDGTQPETCSRSMLGEGGYRACWWVERHRVVYDR